MAQEIERKFLVNKLKWQQLPKAASVVIIQGYLINDAQKSIRIRLMDTKAFITIKGARQGISRCEYEYEIPAGDAKELLGNFCPHTIEKKRYQFLVGNKEWTVDEFSGENEGLLLGEVELADAGEEVEIPVWAAGEVTYDQKYYNSEIALHPYSQWTEEKRDIGENY